MQLRITWGGGETNRWLGKVTLDSGSLSGLQVLSADADAAGSVWIEEGQLHVADLSPHKLDCIEISTQPGPNAKLQIEFATDKGACPRLELSIADLPRHPYQARLDDRGNTIEIQFVPAPALRINTGRAPLIFARVSNARSKCRRPSRIWRRERS